MTNTNTALIFPGQGAQKIGMGKDFFENSPSAKKIFDAAEEVFPGLTKVVFEGPEEELKLTKFAQPGIMSASIAALEVFKTHPKFKQISIKFTAGLSLGEYSALVAGGALSFADALRLVERRSFFMEEATKLAKGTMAAIIGFDAKRLQEICQTTGAEVANFNSPEQIVITGHQSKVEEACRIIKEEGAKTVISLEVSGAFHSSLMRPASEKFEVELKKFSILAPPIPVVTNVNAQPQSTPDEIRQNLAKQIVSSVQWEKSIKYMAGQGIQHFIEIGPGKVLKGLIRRIDSSLKVFNIEKAEDIETLTF